MIINKKTKGLIVEIDGCDDKKKRYRYEGDLVSDGNLDIRLGHPLLINGALKVKGTVSALNKITANKIIATMIVSFDDVSADEIYVLRGITCENLRGYKIETGYIMTSGDIYGCDELCSYDGLSSSMSVMADKIASAGHIRVDGNISGKIIYCRAKITAQGSIRADDLTVAKKLAVGGTISVKKIAFYEQDPMEKNEIGKCGLPKWWKNLLDEEG